LAVLLLANVFFGVWSNFKKLMTADQWLWTCQQCWVHSARTCRCKTVVLIKVEISVFGSYWKDLDSLSPILVEYLGYSLW